MNLISYKGGDLVYRAKRFAILLLIAVVVFGVYKLSIWSDYEYSIHENKVTIIQYRGKATDVVIPVTIWGTVVAGIGERAFMNCDSVENISIPASLTEIGEGAFTGCIGLNGFDVDPQNPYFVSYEGILYSKDAQTLLCYPGGKAKGAIVLSGEQLTHIGSYAFAECSSITSVSLPNSVIYIGNYAFQGCSGLASINIPDNLANINEGTFMNCENLTSIILPDSLISIGNSAFAECGSLMSINIPDGVISIGSKAFDGCRSLVSINLPDNGISIGEFAFDDCPELIIQGALPPVQSAPPTMPTFNYTFKQSDRVPARSYFPSEYLHKALMIIIVVIFVEQRKPTYEGNEGEYYFTVKRKATILKYSGNATQVTIPERLGGEAVTAIGSGVFDRCSNLERLHISRWIASFGDFSFCSCSNLHTIEVAEENTCFTSIEGVLYSKDLQTLLRYPSGRTDSSFIIPDSVNTIWSYAFHDCIHLSSITIPDSVTDIGRYAFSGCSSLTSLRLPQELAFIDDETFYGCSNLMEIILPEELDAIGSSAFDGCKSLKAIVIPDRVTYIGEYSFAKCYSLRSITIPKQVNNIRRNAFESCYSLKQVTMLGDVFSIGDSAYADCISLAEINIPESLTHIGANAFQACSSLTQLNLPEGLISIGEFAFYRCFSLAVNGVVAEGDNADGAEYEWCPHVPKVSC